MNHEILENLITLPPKKTAGWTLELNLVKWYGKPPVYDIREWSEDHEKAGKGLTLSREALEQLIEKMKEIEL